MAVTLGNVASVGSASGTHTTTAATFPSATTAGRTLVAILATGTIAVTTPAGWTLRASVTGRLHVFTKVASGSETTITITHGGVNRSALMIGELSANATFDSIASSVTATPSTTQSIASVTPPAGAPVLLLAADVAESSWAVSAGPAGYTVVVDLNASPPAGIDIRLTVWTRAVTASGSYSSSVLHIAAVTGGTAHIVFAEVVPFTADFTADPHAGDVPLTVDFEDTSSGGTGTPNSWLWDFGDGSTATTQDPTHVYTTVGSFTVTLTVGTDDAESDSETKSGLVVVGDVYVPPPPGIGIIEIRAAAPGSSRWGSALWGEGVWSSAGWVDVTPQSIDAYVRWGSHQPERGILAEVEAGSWIVDTYDPERLLDPGNPDSPYAADLRAGLPIRIRHRETVIRQGVAEKIAYFHEGTVGAIRVTDTLSLLARTLVPPDSVLADTLYERAHDAISAAGLVVNVQAIPPTGDPPLAPRLEGDRSVWRHIADAAEQTLHIAWIDRHGTVRFREWGGPYDRGRGVDQTQLVDLAAIVSTEGLFSVVQADETVLDGGATIERRLTPTPRYGPILYHRAEETLDPGAWADAVLADRSLQTVQWIPGDIYPLTADAVEYFATLEAAERFGVTHTDEAVAVTGIIVGGEFRVRSKREGEAIWTFALELAQTADAPLYVDGADPLEFLLSEAGDEYLYPG